MIVLQMFYTMAFMLSALLSSELTQAAIRLCYRIGFFDLPSDRKAHKNPTPPLGGGALFISFWTTVALGLAFGFMMRPGLLEVQILQTLALSIGGLLPKILGIFAGSLVIFLVGLWDDRYGLSPALKLAGQCAAAAILMSIGLTINLFSELGPIGYLITFVWILLIINAFNFIDSVDGHCTGIALISCTTFFFIVQILQQPVVGFFVIILAGSLYGFLPHNFKPAKIFLGDNGSLFIGYMMAALTLLCSYQTVPPSRVTTLIPLLMFGVPIYDTLSVVVVRLFRGIAPWEGDRNHFAHRLARLGMSEKISVIFSYFVAVTLGLIALLLTQVHTRLGTLIIGLLFFSIIGIVAALEYYAAMRIRMVQELKNRHRRRKEDVQREEDERF